MSFRAGSIVLYGGTAWEVFGAAVDDEGYIGVELIEPNVTNFDEPSAMVFVRELSEIHVMLSPIS